MIPSTEKSSSNSERFLRSLKGGLVYKPTSRQQGDIGSCSSHRQPPQHLSKTTLDHIIAQGAVAAAVAAAGGTAARGNSLLGSHPSATATPSSVAVTEAAAKQAIMNLVLTTPPTAIDPSRLQQ